MNYDIRENQPWGVNQVSNEKPNVPKTDTILSGFIGNSMNGGMNRTVAWKQVMAGERHKEYRFQASIKMLTPKTPSYQNLSMTLRAYFVPNSRVWTNAEKYTAQKGGSSEIKIAEIPNLGGKILPMINSNDEVNMTPIQNTTAWRNAYISSYIPRVGQYAENNQSTDFLRRLPKVSVLPLRGRKAIYNDFERNKEYDIELTEYKNDYVSEAEWNSYLPIDPRDMDIYNMRAKRQNSYYSDYRTELQGFEQSYPPTDMSADVALLNWADWEMKIAEARSQAENAQANDWDIIAKIRGSKKLSEGKVQLLGRKTFNLNYAAVTQNTNNNSQSVTEEFRTMGTQGAYVYTNVDIPLYAGWEFVEEGYIHIIATVSADTVFETGFDRLELNVTPLEQYRPDLIDEKKDVLYECEMGTYKNDSFDYNKIVGFKRKYSEYLKLPNIIAGDLTNSDYFETEYTDSGILQYYDDMQVITNKTYQFFELDTEYEYDNMESRGRLTYVLAKKIWKDYTDIMINKNQAIKNYIVETGDRSSPSDTNLVLEGQHQIFLVGKCVCIAQLPIDDSIKYNYTQWGEH